jgi:2,4-dienoyl-CoA reductase-like NADH-dependent reductase (Old Yellow Enzyme family)
VSARQLLWTEANQSFFVGDAEPSLNMEFGKPRPVTKEDITRVVTGFTHAAEYLDKAGFDGIELHASQDYLLAQFLSRRMSSAQTSAASLEARTRLVRELAAEIKSWVSMSFMLTAKPNSVEYQEGGVTPEEEALELCAILGED